MTKISRLPSMIKAALPALVIGAGCSFATAWAADQTKGVNLPPARTPPATVRNDNGPMVHDVSLDRGGRLTGVVTDSHGAGLGRVAVMLERISPAGRTVAARVETDDAGRFQTPPLTGGAYVATAAGGQSAVRIWKAAAAPPAAAAGVLIVADEQAVLGQSSTSRAYELLEEYPAITYTVITAAIVIPIVEITDDKDDRKKGS